MFEYNESSIQILTRDEADNRFNYALKAKLEKLYPAAHPDFVVRLINACQFIGYDVELAARKYCGKDKTIPLSSELVEVFKMLRDA